MKSPYLKQWQREHIHFNTDHGQFMLLALAVMKLRRAIDNEYSITKRATCIVNWIELQLKKI